jgi:hypothetical protein
MQHCVGLIVAHSPVVAQLQSIGGDGGAPHVVDA